MSKRKRLIISVITGVICGVWGMTAEAAPKPQVNFAEMVGSSEDMAGGTLEPKLVYEEEKDKLRISFRSDGYQERYYTATAFKDIPMELSGKGGITFRISNPLMTSVRMNFALMGMDDRTASVGDGCYVKLQPEDTGSGETSEARAAYTKVEYGCFEVPARFEGMVEIPLDVMAFQDNGASAKKIEEIWGYGIICVVQENQYFELELAEISLLEPAETVDVQRACRLEIVGEEKALRPRVGESETQYHCVAYNMLGEELPAEAVFSLERQYEGVKMTEDGILIVGSTCKAEAIEVRAVTAQGLAADCDLEIYESWVNSIQTDNGYDASLAHPSEIEPIVRQDEKMQSAGVLWGIRGSLMAGGALFMGYYLQARRKYRREA